jgi:5-methylcytosine-specific restriction protein A
MVSMLAEQFRETMATALAILDAARAPSTPAAEKVEVFRDYGIAHDQLDTRGVLMIADMTREGIFSDAGYPKPQYAVADLWSWDQRPARRRVQVADQVCPRIGLDGQVLPPHFPTTGAVMGEGRIAVAHAEAIVTVLNGPCARRLCAETWAGAEEQIAQYAATTHATPSEVAAFAKQLVGMLDQDGPEPPEEPEQVNELYRTRNRRGTGGRIRGELDGPTYDALDTLLSAMNKPHPDDGRTQAHREADTLGELCEFALRHNGDLPDTGGERPQIRVTLDYDQLRTAVAGAHLDTGAWYSPSQLRMLACDCGIIPILLASSGEPLDIGRATRTIPLAIRRAVAARDHGCAYPGCHRPPAWCDVHHCTEWHNGGETTVHNCAMLCRTHHRIVHNAGWVVQIRQDQPNSSHPNSSIHFKQYEEDHKWYRCNPGSTRPPSPGMGAPGVAPSSGRRARRSPQFCPARARGASQPRARGSQPCRRCGSAAATDPASDRSRHSHGPHPTRRQCTLGDETLRSGMTCRDGQNRRTMIRRATESGLQAAGIDRFNTVRVRCAIGICEAEHGLRHWYMWVWACARP